MKPRVRSAFELEVESAIRRAKLTLEVQPRIGGLLPDFLVTTPSGKKVIVEAKGWKMDEAAQRRAVRQVQRYTEATNADQVLLVVPRRPSSWKAAGVVSIDGLLANLLKEPAAPPRRALKVRARRVEIRPATKSTATVFAAMPFAPEFDDVYLVSMAGAAERNGVTCVRVDHETFEGDIVSHIKDQINRSVAVIADLSDAKPNVMFEVGYAHGKGKVVVPISSTQLASLPFDVRNWNTLKYTRGGTHALITPLAARLKEVLERGPA